ncbi:MAG: histidine kinase, partial [Actinomycetota bacterium]|nr:histidine kinase [Actinomycetota bacterium]
GSTALGAPSAGDATDTTALLLQLERELDRVAEEIHEGPAQALAAARFAADAAALRGADVTAVREAVQDALAAVRRAVWELRTPAVSSGLGEALAGLSERMDDGPGLTLQGRPADLASLSLVPSVVATSAYRLVQAALRAATSPVRIGVAAGVGVVELTVRGHGLTATDRAEWALRLSAVGAHLVAEPSALRLLLPTSAPDEPARRA